MECSVIAAHNDAMFGRQGYKKNKDSYQPPPLRYNVVDAKSSTLYLCTTIMGKKAIRDFACDSDNFAKAISYLENGKGCSVDIQRGIDGRDFISAMYNTKTE
jgi:hypothetical protein